MVKKSKFDIKGTTEQYHNETKLITLDFTPKSLGKLIDLFKLLSINKTY